MVREERPEFRRFYDALERFLREKVDSVAIDETGEYPENVVDGLRKLGAFGIKIPKEYGGLGFTVTEYTTIMQMVGSYDGNIGALLSAHQSIGVPQPLKLFGTPEQKKKYLPRCAAGAISAFALTEPHVGSDPASLSTTAERDGDTFVLNGEKLWCTNGTLAELLVVMARDPETKKISAFIVETGWPGVKVEHRCRFMGLKALANGVVSFQDVRVPRENLDRRGGQGAQDRPRHAQHRAPDAAGRLHRDRQALPRDRVGAGRTSASSGASRSGSTRRSPPPRGHGRHDLRHGIGVEAGERDGGPRRLRHPARGRRRQGVEHRPRLGDRRRDPADPRRPRLRDRALARGARRVSRSRSSA